MKSMRLFLMVMTLLCFGLGASAETVEAVAADAAEKPLSVRTFQFKHKDAEKAAAVVKPLLSAAGSLSMQAGSNALVVSDTPETIKSIAAALAAFDVPPQRFQLAVRLVAASRVKGETPKVPDELKDVASKLALLQYNAFESLGAANVESREGDPSTVELQNGYRADFRLGEYDLASNTVKIEDFRLSKLQGEQLTQMLKTTLNLKVGQMFILGATKSAQTQRALMVVVTAKR